MELYQWNTGRLYTREGQRMKAEVDLQTGKVLFRDFDRMIWGELTTVPPAGWAMMSEGQRINWIHGEYDAGRYTWNGLPSDWELPSGTFAQHRI